MSSCVVSGAAPPRLSCTCGPTGTAGSAGGAPRLGFTRYTSKPRLSGSHWTLPPPPPRPPPATPLPPPAAAPITALIRAPSTLCVLPVAVSPIHNSMPLAVAFVNAKCALSGLQCPALNFGFGGSSTFVSVPSGILRMVRALLKVTLCRPFVRGLMRCPASRSIGCESSAMDG